MTDKPDKPIKLAEYRLEGDKYVKKFGGPGFVDEFQLASMVRTPGAFVDPKHLRERTPPPTPPTKATPIRRETAGSNSQFDVARRRYEAFSWREREKLAKERPAFFKALLREREMRRELGMADASSSDIVAHLRKQKRTNALAAYQRVLDTIEYNLHDDGPGPRAA